MNDTVQAEATVKKVNYTPEMVDQAVAMYAELGNDGLEQIAEAIGKNVRSVRSKLVRENVYVAPEKGATVAKDQGPTKKELLQSLDAMTPFVIHKGFDGATKQAVTDLIDYFQGVSGPDAVTSDEEE